VNAKPGARSSTYVATLPREPAANHWDFFAFVTDDRSFSTASAMLDSAMMLGGVDGGEDAAFAEAGPEVDVRSDTSPADAFPMRDASITIDAAGPTDASKNLDARPSGEADASSAIAQRETGVGCSCRFARTPSPKWPASIAPDLILALAVRRMASARNRRRTGFRLTDWVKAVTGDEN
jgi:hypothetical protein